MKSFRVDRRKLEEHEKFVDGRIDKLRELKLLTKRQAQIAKLICKGHTNKKISDKFKLVERTVEYHRNRIYGTLGASNTLELLYSIMFFEMGESK